MNGGTPIPEGSIVITPAEMYAEVRTLTVEVRELVASDKAEGQARNEDRARVAALETKVESKADNERVAALEAKVESKADTERVDKLDTRVSVIEKKFIFATGAAAALGGGIGTWLPKLLGS